eukprot:s1355_g9.t1
MVREDAMSEMEIALNKDMLALRRSMTTVKVTTKRRKSAHSITLHNLLDKGCAHCPKVLNSVAKRGKDATEFLRLICARSRWPYERQEQLRPLLDALARARQIDPAAHNWWAYVNPEHQHCIEQDSFRVIMSEYLCLTAHLEVVDFADGRISEAQCLRCCQTWRLSLAKALGLLRTSGGFTLTTVNGDASKRVVIFQFIREASDKCQKLNGLVGSAEFLQHSAAFKWSTPPPDCQRAETFFCHGHQAAKGRFVPEWTGHSGDSRNT